MGCSGLATSIARLDALFDAAFETLRVYRPRLLIHGQKGLGQRFYGAALLHHLEGYHVQNLDIATLLGQSTAVSLWSPALVTPRHMILNGSTVADYRNDACSNVCRSQASSTLRPLHPRTQPMVRSIDAYRQSDFRHPVGQPDAVRTGHSYRIYG